MEEKAAMTKEKFIEKYNMPPMPVQRVWSFKSDLDTLLREVEHKGYIRGLHDHTPIRQKRIRKPKLRF